MVRLLITVGLAALLALTNPPDFSAQAPPVAAANTIILDTEKGQIEIETLPADAPKTVERFVDLAKRGFYRGQRFHWVQPGLVQAGDPLSRDMTKHEKWGTGGSGPNFGPRPLRVAETSKRAFDRGIVGMAYRPGYRPDTVDSMFIILKGANPPLNGKYPVIGRVTKGMAVVDKIEKADLIKFVTVK